MNFIDKVKNRKSIRNFIKNKVIDAKDKQDILAVINNAPASNNYFVSSAIVVEDIKLLEQLGKLLHQKHVADSSLFIVFLADYNRIKIVNEIENNKDKNNSLNLAITAFGDAFIQSAMAQDAAINNNLGTCYIGGVRQYIEEIRQILNIKGKALPIIGLAIGYPENSFGRVKPKIQRVFKNKYDIESVNSSITPYNKTLSQYYFEQKYDFDYIKEVNKYINDDNSKIDEIIKKILQLL
ncbi:nitroreductase family protein [Mycoplasma sp. U97]|uniref:nitroreductase family protein n=1 Tax=Mycoplasma tauri TaxID=547987 RepID=UPI001CBFD04B|nr:nitroreductase family protein [Mycoplasma tauri]MBZ4212687.1 nitroreductase family protein [Mycoplasma tauri]